MNYSEQLKSPMWQKKRLEIMQRDNFTCSMCFSKTKQLTVHHVTYAKNKKAWEYNDKNFKTLCADCHSMVHYIQDSFNVNFVRFTEKCINDNSLSLHSDYMRDMGKAFKHYYKDYETTKEIYLNDDSLVFDSLTENRTYVFCNFFIDDTNKVIYIDHFFDAKY